jgi:hypothetical protein
MKYLNLCIVLIMALAACTPDNKGAEKIPVSGTGSQTTPAATQSIAGKIQVSDDLKSKGFKFGKYAIEKGNGSDNFNVLHVYVSFNNDAKEMVNVRVYDKKENEYGRTSKKVKGKNGDAKWIDFEFDSRTNLEDGSRFEIE